MVFTISTLNIHMEVKDKTVIVTGAASGIGAATSRHFAANGAKVIVSDINEDKAADLVNEIKQHGGHAVVKPANVSNYDEVKQLISDTVSEFGKLDVLVNNAGIGPKQLTKTDKFTLEDWDSVIAVNQTGVFYGMKEALKYMVEQKEGNIVNVASLAGLKASLNNLSYSASKFAVIGMTKSTALEYVGNNIRINAVCPGYTESSLLDKMLNSKPEMDERLKSMIPMKRYGKAEEVAEAVVWLASDTTKFITGQTITLDGGLSL